ncbi:hypothetical protein BCR43DRAFT_458230 [Syncephalastrum racemosum]|uniref:BTB domain-containing protein n=1 Tax=Syncephalastrum racemosum TaxID=13706 RepID=A0A1X2HCK1_SYNRA|nr:hypothetical protein BCR43DRAFT_458230 [Syncephalastrum racemosum]
MVVIFLFTARSSAIHYHHRNNLMDNNNINNNNNGNGNSNNPNGFFNFDFPFQILDDGRDYSTSGNPFDTSAIPSDLLQFMNDDQMFSTAQNPTDLLPALPPAPSATPSATASTTAVEPPATITPQTPDNTRRKRRRDNNDDESLSRSTEEQQAGAQPQADQVQKEDVQEPSNQTMMVIVVGGRAFRLSWESLKSDGPNNFFTDFLRRTQTRLMHVDRDADTFAVIVHHLRGYSVQPRTQMEYQNLMNDAVYYNLRRLRKLLQDFAFLNVGGREFRLPWSLLKKDGGARNFFTGPLMHRLFEPHGQDSPIYIDRDPDTFQDVIRHLQGYTLHIRDEAHRQNLLKDAMYYRLKQLRVKVQAGQPTVEGFVDPRVETIIQKNNNKTQSSEG